MKKTNFSLVFTFIAFIFLANLAYSIDAPKMLSPDQNEWVAYRVPLEWAPVNGATGYAFFFDTNPVSEVTNQPCVDANKVSYAPLDGSYYFHIASCSGSSRSGTINHKFSLDSTPPSGIENFAVEPTTDGKLKLTWNAATDESSGVGSYILYKSRLFKFNIDDISTRKIENVKGTEYIDSDVEERGQYNYRLAAIDNAGIRGLVTYVSKGARVNGSCSASAPVTISYDLAKKLLLVSASSGTTMKQIELSVGLKDSNSPAHTFDDNTSISYEYSLEGKGDGAYSAILTYTDEEGDPCVSNALYSLDTAKPSVQFIMPKNNGTIDEDTKFVVAVSDPEPGSGLTRAALYLAKENDANFSRLSPFVKDENNYTYDFNLAGKDPGYYKLKVVAEDVAGNTEESIINFLVSNKQAETTKAAKQISDAQSALDDFKKSFEIANKIGISTADADAKISEAASLISSANSALSSKNYALASSDAAKASSAVEDAKKLMSVSVYKEDSFSFNRPKLVKLLIAEGISENAASEAETYFDKYQPKRNLTLVKVNDLNGEYYTAFVEITTKAAGDGNSISIYETIPKEIINALGKPSFESGKAISEEPFKVIAETKAVGTTQSLTYIFPAKLSKEDADALLANRQIQIYPIPPLAYDSSSTYLKSEFSGSGTSSILPLVAIGVIIVIVIGAAVFFYTKLPKHKRNFFPKKKKLGK